MAEPLLSADRLAEIRAALTAVPAPPWQWIGDRRTRAMLATTHSGWQYLLSAERPKDHHGDQAENPDGAPIWSDLEFRHQADGEKYATLTPARELAVGRTDYDQDTIRDIDNPVARLLRDAPQYVTELLAEVERLTAALVEARRGEHCALTDYALARARADKAEAAAYVARRDGQPQTDEAACQVCGCTENHACEGGCWWVPNPLGVDLCSACVHSIAALADSEAAAEALADQTKLRSLTARPGSLAADLEPPHELAVAMVEQAKKILGDAQNYTETPVILTVKAAGEVERYAFIVQRVGRLTPHEAREQAEAERDQYRHALVQQVRDCGSRHGEAERADYFEGMVPDEILAEAFPKEAGRG